MRGVRVFVRGRIWSLHWLRAAHDVPVEAVRVGDMMNVLRISGARRIFLCAHSARDAKGFTLEQSQALPELRSARQISKSARADRKPAL